MRIRILFLAVIFLLTFVKISFAQNISEIPVDLNDKESCKKYVELVCAETLKLLSQEDLLHAPNYDLLRAAVEKISDGKNTVILDAVGYPSIMVKIEKFTVADKKIHPMFKVNQKIYPCVYIGKYESSIYHGRAYSLPNVDPATMVNISQAREFCKNKGRGWHVTSNIEFAGISYLCYENKFYPHGNTNAKIDENFYPNERGRITFEKRNDKGIILIRRMATGSGPATWAHDGTENGIYDLNGNVWEMAEGIRQVNGEIQFIPDNNAALFENWNDWYAVSKRGKLTKKFSKNTWKFDSTKSDSEKVFKQIEGAIPFLSLKRKNSMYAPEDVSTNYGFGTCTFSEMTATQKVPEILKEQMIFPSEREDFTDSRIWVRNYGTRRILRGGFWWHTTGIFGYSFSAAWNDKSPGIGFRISYIDFEEKI